MGNAPLKYRTSICLSGAMVVMVIRTASNKTSNIQADILIAVCLEVED